MTDATDDMEMANYTVPDGIFYVYWHEGKKYSFRTLEEANRWAKSKGFKLATRDSKGDA